MSAEKLNYKIIGRRGLPVVVFLHGFMGASEDWLPVVKRLSIKFRCVIIDLPGHGRSLFEDEELYSMPSASDSILDILDYNDIDKFGLCGYSMGGRLALYIAVMNPDRIEKLFLESSSPGIRSEAERVARVVNDILITEKIIKMDFEDFLNEWYDMPFFKAMKEKPAYPELLGRRLNNDTKYIVKSLNNMGTGVQPSLWEQWAAFKPKTALVVGELDEKYNALANEMLALRPGTELKIIPETGHNAHFENRDLFIKYAEEFFNNIKE